MALKTVEADWLFIVPDPSVVCAGHPHRSLVKLLLLSFPKVARSPWPWLPLTLLRPTMVLQFWRLLPSLTHTSYIAAAGIKRHDKKQRKEESV